MKKYKVKLENGVDYTIILEDKNVELQKQDLENLQKFAQEVYNADIRNNKVKTDNLIVITDSVSSVSPSNNSGFYNDMVDGLTGSGYMNVNINFLRSLKQDNYEGIISHEFVHLVQQNEQTHRLIGSHSITLSNIEDLLKNVSKKEGSINIDKDINEYQEAKLQLEKFISDNKVDVKNYKDFYEKILIQKDKKDNFSELMNKYENESKDLYIALKKNNGNVEESVSYKNFSKSFTKDSQNLIELSLCYSKSKEFQADIDSDRKGSMLKFLESHIESNEDFEHPSVSDRKKYLKEAIDKTVNDFNASEGFVSKEEWQQILDLIGKADIKTKTKGESTEVDFKIGQIKLSYNLNIDPKIISESQQGTKNR